jgi:hypothetical protein
MLPSFVTLFSSPLKATCPCPQLLHISYVSISCFWMVESFGPKLSIRTKNFRQEILDHLIAVILVVMISSSPRIHSLVCLLHSSILLETCPRYSQYWFSVSSILNIFWKFPLIISTLAWIFLQDQQNSQTLLWHFWYFLKRSFGLLNIGMNLCRRLELLVIFNIDPRRKKLILKGTLA